MPNMGPGQHVECGTSFTERVHCLALPQKQNSLNALPLPPLETFSLKEANSRTVTSWVGEARFRYPPDWRQLEPGGNG